MLNKMNENYELLRKKEIIEILDGDTTIEELDGFRVAMPYLSGPQLCELSQKFGCFQEYYWGNSKKTNLSRWLYLDNLLKYLIAEKRVSELLSYMMDKERFLTILRPLKTVDEIENRYQYIIKSVLEKINSILYFGGHELYILSNQYIIRKIGTKVELEATNLKIIKEEEKMEERKFTTADKEYRSAWAKTLMGVKLDETEERALGDAIGTTATEFVASAEGAQGINNYGLLIPDSVRMDWMKIVEELSPIYRDVTKLNVNGKALQTGELLAQNIRYALQRCSCGHDFEN